MEDGQRRAMRADAERNRRRLLEAAAAVFGERGLDVGVAEVAQRAGVGRGTLFRNFPTKEHLIAAIVVERMRESIDRGRQALEAPDAGEALFSLIEAAVERSQSDRALFDALADAWLVNDEIRATHAELLATLDALVRRAQAAGAVRPDVGAVDVMVMIKGVCEASCSFQHVDPSIRLRQLDLIRAALTAPADAAPLRGRPPTLADLEPEGARSDQEPGASGPPEPSAARSSSATSTRAAPPAPARH